jgi:hypothetical protein
VRGEREQPIVFGDKIIREHTMISCYRLFIETNSSPNNLFQWAHIETAELEWGILFGDRPLPYSDVNNEILLEESEEDQEQPECNYCLYKMVNADLNKN